MQTLTILFLTILAVGAFAQTPAPPVNPSPYGGYTYPYSVTPPNPAENCIQDICGPPPQSNLYMTKYIDRVGDYFRVALDPAQTSFSPSISKLFADLLAEKNKQSETGLELLKKSSDMGDARLEGLTKAVYNLQYAAPFLKQIKYKISEADGKSVVVVDEEASSSSLKDLSAEDRSWVFKIGRFWIKASSEISDNEVTSQPIQILLKKIHRESSVADAMKMELVQAQRSIDSLKNLSPLEKGVLFNKTSPERMALIAIHVAQGTVDENEAREVIQWNRDFKTLNELFLNSDSPLLQRPTPRVEEIIKKRGGLEAMEKASNKRDADQRRKDLDKIQECQMQYFLNKGLLPTQDQVNVLKRDIARSKQMVREMIKSKFPSSTQQKLIKAVDDADFILPPSANDFEKSFSDNIRRKLDAEKKNTVAFARLRPQDLRQVAAAIAQSDDTNEKDNSNEFCEAFKYSPMSDANYTAYGSIMLSFTTATGDESSRLKTVMHELGHSISKAIADDPEYFKQFAGVRNCLKAQHTEVFPESAENYVEEDFADTVAGNVGQVGHGRNAWCQFLSLTYDRQQYQESTIQPSDGDTHSTSLFRLFNFEMMTKGHLPDSCKSYLKSAGYKEHFSSCFDLTSQGATPAQSTRAVH